MPDSTIQYRLKQLEDQYSDIASKLDIIRTNHLPHIEMEIIAVKTELRILAGLNILSIIILIILQKLGVL